MIKPKIALPAERILTDPQSAGTTLVNILQSIQPFAAFPWAFPQLVFWAAFQRDLSDSPIAAFKFRVCFNDATMTEVPVAVNFPGSHIITNVIFNLSGLVVPSPGKLQFQILNTSDGSIAYEYVLPILQREITQLPLQGLPTDLENVFEPLRPA